MPDLRDRFQNLESTKTVSRKAASRESARSVSKISASAQNSRQSSRNVSRQPSDLDDDESGSVMSEDMTRLVHNCLHHIFFFFFLHGQWHYGLSRYDDVIDRFRR